MATREFLPDASILAHAGNSFAQLFSSYALLVRDTTESIFETMKQAAIMHKRDARAVISFSQLRPSSDVISSTQTQSSGPVAFMKIFDSAMRAFVHDEESISLDGVFLNVDHPDIFDFISQAESESASFKRFVGVSESFMKAVRQDADFGLINPRTHKLTQNIRARKLFRLLVSQMCKTTEPGLLFLDRLEAANPTPKMGFLVATSADGSQAFLPYETSANGFINLGLCVREKAIDWEKLKGLVHKGVHFLENTLEISSFPFPENAEIVKRNRKIGLGVTGWANALQQLGVSYESEAALSLASKTMAFIEHEADNASIALAHKRGSFPNYNDSPLSLRAQKRRHACVTAIANSEQISLLAECSPGILPFSEKQAIDSEWKLRTQAAFQGHTENGVYLPIDLPKDSNEEEVAKVFILAHQLGLKSVVFRRPNENSPLRLVPGREEDSEITASPELKNGKQGEEGTYFNP
jgi:ribonucleoside-diphosphate reductase alpha chain